MLKQKLFSGTPANVQVIGLAFTTIVLVTGVFSAGLYVSLAGSTVNVPAGLYGFSISRFHQGGSYVVLRSGDTFEAAYSVDDQWVTIGKVLGPNFDYPDYEPSTIALGYPFLPVIVDIHKRTTSPFVPRYPYGPSG